LSADDLSKIHEKNLPTFAFNRIYLMFDKTDWRPTYYISQDEKTLKNCTTEVGKMELANKFIPLNVRYYYDIEINGATYFKMIPDEVEGYLFSDDISSCVVNSNTVACTAAQFAAYMGFKRIYLIGVDHNFSTYQNDKGEIIKDNNVKDYFVADYNKDKSELYIPNLDASTRTYIEMKRYCDDHKIEVFNATRGGKLEVFQRVDLDEVLNSI